MYIHCIFTPFVILNTFANVLSGGNMDFASEQDFGSTCCSLCQRRPTCKSISLSATLTLTHKNQQYLYNSKLCPLIHLISSFFFSSMLILTF